MGIDYKSVKLRVGLELHVQLNTVHKLFCNCSTAMKEKDAERILQRRQHIVASELGDVDRAAQYEFLRHRSFNYQIFPKEVCLVESDEEPPHEVNKEALDVALKIAIMFNCHVPDEIHVMRKTVIDGSNTGGFQRTMIVGMGGWIKYKDKRVEISQISLEEDASAIVPNENGKVTFRLNRLGTPLVEIDTGILEGFLPEEVQEIASMMGLIAKSTGKLKRGLGTIRQDVNVSVKGGNRVEIKGVQDLGLMDKVIEFEANRQLALIQEGKRVDEETRAAKEDGTTVFNRPLPGSARMYPETDVEPVVVDRNKLEEIKKSLPETWDKKMERFKKNLGLSDLLAKEIVRSNYLDMFEKITSSLKVEPTIVANTFTSVIKDLERRGRIKQDNLEENTFMEIFHHLQKGKLFKEAIPDVVDHLFNNPGESLDVALNKLRLEPVTKEELDKVIHEAVSSTKEFGKVMNMVIGKLRGRVDTKVAMEEIKKKLKS